MQLDLKKLSSLAHYIISECRSDPSKLGKTKLNKILWFTDSFAYALWGEAITGESYKKLQFGPVPIHLQSVLDDLRSSGRITIDDDVGDYQTVLYYSSKKPDITCFSEKEMNIINSKIEWIRDDHSASSISDKTHDKMWQIAEMHGILPYEAAAVTFAKVTEEDFMWARQQSV